MHYVAAFYTANQQQFQVHFSVAASLLDIANYVTSHGITLR